MQTERAHEWISGDFIADTPPTGSTYYNTSVYPKPSSTNTRDCTIAFDSSQFCTKLPDGPGNMRNFMSYDEMGCRSLFTDLQIARMRCWVDQDFGPTSPVLPDMGAGLVTF